MASKALLKTFILIFFLLLLTSNFLFAEVPPKFINYQGKLTNTSGTPLNGAYTMAFTIYDAETGGTSQWTETQSPVAVSNGIYNVILGSGTDGKPDTGDDVKIPASVFYGEQRWLGVTIGSDSEMTPRMRLTSVPYAITADNLGGGYAYIDSTGNINIGGNGGRGTLIIAHNGNIPALDITSTGTINYAPIELWTDSSGMYVHSSSTSSNHFLLYLETAGTDRFAVRNNGNVGIGTGDPAYKLDVKGYVQAQGYYTGDIFFQKDGKKLWRMFEDEKGLYLENLKSKKISKVFLEEDIAAMKEEIKKEIMEELGKR